MVKKLLFSMLILCLSTVSLRAQLLIHLDDFAEEPISNSSGPESQSIFNLWGGESVLSLDELAMQNTNIFANDTVVQTNGIVVDRYAPIGSGWVILLTAGLGYGALKTRNNKRKDKKE